MSELVLENVSYAYKGSDRKAVSDVSVHFEESKVNAVIGPSGSGKTTLLSIMAGLDSPTEGDALIDGERLSGMDLDQYRREKVSMIFQAFHLFPLLTVIENVCFPMELNGVEKEAAIERAKIYLQSVGITEEKHKLSTTEAINIFLHQVILTGGLPFEVKNPQYNDETLAAIREARDIIAGKVPAKSYNNIAELMEDLNSDDDN